MSSEVTMICDGCENLVSEKEECVQISIRQIDTGSGITSSPVLKDYHPGCLPEAVKEIGYEHNNLVAASER